MSLTRRGLLRAGAGAGASLILPSELLNPAQAAAGSRTPATLAATYNFNRNWRFGGIYRKGSQNPGYGDGGFKRVTLPHTVTSLSWGGWNPAKWQNLWIYRKPFSTLGLPAGRVLLSFDGVLTNATVYLNGMEIADHIGGFLPFTVEVTGNLRHGHNDLGLVVDGRILRVPPLGSSFGANAVDYLMPAGIYRDVTLRVVPDAYISNVFAKPVNVLSSPGLDLAVTLDSTRALRHPATLAVELMDGSRMVASATQQVHVHAGQSVVHVNMKNLRGIRLWSPSSPKLYSVRVKLTPGVMPAHEVTVSTGFREAVFELNGFYLNGERLQIFGLNRHQLFPYVGMAASARLQARDAQRLKQELNCNMVRCSHYPQSPHFLDACDSLGLMVWEEPPGWQYIGGPNFDATLLQNVHDMVIRDRNRPSVVVWGTRLDETSTYPTLYAEARQMAKALDGTRQTTGAMASQSTTNWAEDVFALDDYTGSKGNATPDAPLPGVPYMISEAVGAVTGPPLYRWIDSSATLMDQAKLHAQVNQVAFGNHRYAGVLGWCGIDYASLVGGGRNWENIKWPGVLDSFRVAKPGAAFYRSQVSPDTVPLIIPAFYWDFGPSSPSTGPGPGSILATNCEELHVYVGGELLTVATPDQADFGNLPYPPVLVDLTVDGSTFPDLVVQGYIQGALVATLQMASDTSRDHLGLFLEDGSISADGIDMTRVTFRALDRYGNQRPYVSDNVSLHLSGPASLIGQNPFAFEQYGGVGGAIIRSQPGRRGRIVIRASHPTLGSASAALKAVRPTGSYL